MNYEYPIKLAEDKIKERYPKYKFITKIPKILFPNKDVYLMCYSYFRWFDDIVDSEKLSQKDINLFIQRQKEYFSKLYSNEVPEELSTEELFLAHLVDFDKEHDKNLKNDIGTLINTFEFDASRKGKIVTASSIDNYVEDNIVPYVNVSLAFFDLENLPKNDLYSIARTGFVLIIFQILKKI